MCLDWSAVDRKKSSDIALKNMYSITWFPNSSSIVEFFWITHLYRIYSCNDKLDHDESTEKIIDAIYEKISGDKNVFRVYIDELGTRASEKCSMVVIQTSSQFSTAHCSAMTYGEWKMFILSAITND